MKEIIEANYKSIVDRGLIAPSTNRIAFFCKLDEEITELKYASFHNKTENFKEELADVIMVCLNFAKHYDIDIEQEIKKKIEVNKQRAKNGK